MRTERAPSASGVLGASARIIGSTEPLRLRRRLDVKMKSGGPWNLKSLRPEARAAASDAARRSGMSVAEWLDSVVAPTQPQADDARRLGETDGRQTDRSERQGREDIRDRD